MIRESHPGYKCHIFVCVNNRTDERKACAHNIEPMNVKHVRIIKAVKSDKN